MARSLLLAAALCSPAAGAGQFYTVRGTVLAPNGQPMAEAILRLVHRAYPAEESTLPTEVRTRSDEDGEFELRFDLDLLSGKDRLQARWTLVVEAPRTARYLEGLPRTYTSNRSGRTEELGGILLEPGRSAVGRLAADPGLAMQSVSLWPLESDPTEPWEGEVDAEGLFEVGALPAGDYVFLVEGEERPALFAGHVVIMDEVCPRFEGHGRRCDLGEVRIIEPRKLTGRVADGEGRPLADVELSLAWTGPPVRLPGRTRSRAVTGADGRFVLTLDHAALTYEVTAEKRGFRRRTIEGEVAETTGRRLELAADLVLERASELVGRVVDDRGHTIVGATITAQRAGQQSGLIEYASTAGTFVFDGLAEGSYELQVRAPGFAARTITASARLGDASADDLVIVLDRLATFDLEVVVRDRLGAAITGVHLEVSKQADEEPYFNEATETDGAGRGRLRHLPAGAHRYLLRARHPDFQPLFLEGLELGPADDLLEVELEPLPWKRMTVQGRVRAPDGSPVPGARVELDPVRYGERRLTGSDAEGRFQWDKVRPGAYRLAVQARALALDRRDVVVAETMRPLEVRLERGAVIEGEVRGLDAGQLARVRIEAQAGGQEALVAEVAGSRYRIEYVGRGEWILRAYLDDNLLEKEIAVRLGDTSLTHDFEFPSLHRVRCSIHVDGEPASPSVVHLERRAAGFSGYHVGRPEGAGVFDFELVAAGVYELTYYGAKGGVRRTLTVDGEAECELDLATGWIEGRVVDDESGSGIEGVVLEAMGDVFVTHSGRPEPAVSDAAGRFRLGPVIVGEWLVSAKLRSEWVADARVEVTSYPSAPLTMRVDLDTGLALRVGSESGRPPRSVQVFVRDAEGVTRERGVASLDATGVGLWRGAPEGSWSLWASDGFSWLSIGVEVPGKEVALFFPLAGTVGVEVPALQIEKQIAAELQLRFLGDPQPGRRVEFRRAISPHNRLFHVNGLQPGPWSAEVTSDDGRVWRGEVEISHGGHYSLVLDD